MRRREFSQSPKLFRNQERLWSNHLDMFAQKTLQILAFMQTNRPESRFPKTGPGPRARPEKTEERHE